jgi:hypothetical protein
MDQHDKHSELSMYTFFVAVGIIVVSYYYAFRLPTEFSCALDLKCVHRWSQRDNCFHLPFVRLWDGCYFYLNNVQAFLHIHQRISISMVYWSIRMSVAQNMGGKFWVVMLLSISLMCSWDLVKQQCTSNWPRTQYISIYCSSTHCALHQPLNSPL